MQQSAIPTSGPAMHRAERAREWARTLTTFALVAPLPAALLWAAFSMPGTP